MYIILECIIKPGCKEERIDKKKKKDIHSQIDHYDDE